MAKIVATWTRPDTSIPWTEDEGGMFQNDAERQEYFDYFQQTYVDTGLCVRTDEVSPDGLTRIVTHEFDSLESFTMFRADEKYWGYIVSNRPAYIVKHNLTHEIVHLVDD